MGTRLAAEGATDRASQIAAIDLFVVLTSFSTVWRSLFTVEDGRRPQVPNPPGCGTGKRARKRSQRGHLGSAAHDSEALPNNPAAVPGQSKALANFCETTTGDAELSSARSSSAGLRPFHAAEPR